MKAIHADRVDQEYQMKWDFDPAAERFDSPMVEKRPLTFTCTSAPEGDVNESVDPDSCWDCFHSADDPDPAVTILTYKFRDSAGSDVLSGCRVHGAYAARPGRSRHISCLFLRLPGP